MLKKDTFTQTRGNLNMPNSNLINIPSYISSPFNFSTFTTSQPWQKPRVIDNLNNNLRNIEIAKNNQKLLYDTDI